MNSRLPESLSELMWTGHMGESHGVMASGSRGTPPSPRTNDQPEIEITTENELDIFNLGVAAGVAGLLEALDEAGYKLIDREGRTVPKETCLGKTYTWGETFYRYLNDETAKLVLVHGRPVTPPLRPQQIIPAPTAEILPFNKSKASPDGDCQ